MRENDSQVGCTRILADVLCAAGLTAADTLVYRIALNPADRDEDYRSTADLVRTGHALTYGRLQDGPVFGPKALVVSFVAADDGTTRFAGLQTFVARRPGVAPGDIIYDPEIAHLLHNFIARAQHPTFYDAFDDERGKALEGIALRWPAAAGDLRQGDDPSLFVIKDET